MRHMILITMIAIFCLLTVTLWGQRNNYRKADHALQMVYKQVTGISLKDAIDSLIAEQPDSLYDSISQANENPPPKRGCPPPKSSNHNLVYIPNDSVIPPVELTHYQVSPGKAGTHYVSAQIGFVGNIDDLRMFSVGDMFPYSKTSFGFVLILEKLPELCQTKGVQHIKIKPMPTLE